MLRCSLHEHTLMVWWTSQVGAAEVQYGASVDDVVRVLQGPGGRSLFRRVGHDSLLDIDDSGLILQLIEAGVQDVL